MKRFIVIALIALVAGIAFAYADVNVNDVYLKGNTLSYTHAAAGDTTETIINTNRLQGVNKMIVSYRTTAVKDTIQLAVQASLDNSNWFIISNSDAIKNVLAANDSSGYFVETDIDAFPYLRILSKKPTANHLGGGVTFKVRFGQ